MTTKNSKIYRQADSRWKDLPYPTKAYSFGGNGCGACSVLHCIIEQDKYKNWTPKDIQPYMKQFATKGHGTLWAGIKTALEHYGYKVHWKQSDSMSDIFKVIEASPIKRGVILFGSTEGPDGTVWTKSGHYIAFTDYKKENGKHYFYLKDSGGRHHDKFWQFEKSMRGDCRQVFICTGLKDEPAPKPTPTPTPGTYTGKWPSKTVKKGSKGTDVERWQKYLKWLGYNITVDGKFGKITKAKTKDCQERYLGFSGKDVDGIVGPKTIKKAKTVKKNNEVKPKETTPQEPQNADIKALNKVIDVSYWQHDIDFQKAKKAGVDGVIARASYTSQSSFQLNVDSTFSKNVNGANSAGLPVGAYHYSQAISVSEAKKEAEHICNRCNPYGKKISLPIVFDWEFGGRLSASKAKSLGKAKCTEIVEAFCDTVKAKGYVPMVYCNLSTFQNYVDYKKLRSKYKIWLAQYASKPSITDYDLWQYTSSGSISGISGKVDVNVGKNGKKN